MARVRARRGLRAGRIHPVRLMRRRRRAAVVSAMDMFEIETKDRMTREQAAALLHELADHLARHNDVEFSRGGTAFKVRVPDEVDVKVEFETGGDGSELEVELSW